MNIQRVKYIVKRLRESPWSFLYQKGKVELHKKLFHSQESHFLKSKVSKEFQLLINHIRKPIAIELSDEELAYLSARVKSYSNGYPCLGYGNVDILSQNAFSTDCIHNYTWSDNSCSFTIDFIKANVKCDVKIPWEKSRLQWLTEMAILCDNKAFEIKDVYKHLERWRQANPLNKGINWVSSMEVAIRAINLVFILLLLEKHNSQQLTQLILTCLSEHKVYLDLFPEISDIPGNHFLATEVGLAAIMFVQGKSYNRFKFLDLLNQQFPNDGMQLEYSTIYNRLCVDLAMVGFAFIDCGLTEPSLTNKLYKLFDSVSAFASARSLLPIFGDSDSGQVFNFGQDSRDASFYTKSPKKSIPIKINSLLLNAINSKVASTLDRYEPVTSSCLTIYPFHILKNRTFKVISRFGKAGLNGRAPHDHDDVMSFWAFKNGCDFVVERGCAPYTLNLDERKKIIGSESHNTLNCNLDTQKAIKQGSIFPIVKLRKATINLATNYLLKLSKGSHVRTISIEDSVIKVQDDWDCNKPAISFFFVAKNVEVNINKKDGVESSSFGKDEFYEDYGAASQIIKKFALKLECKGSYEIELS